MVVHIACAVERNYIAHSAAMLASAALRSQAQLKIHYAHPPRFPSRDRRRLEAMAVGFGAEIEFIEVPDALVAGLPTRGFTRKATWYRIFLPELLAEIDRVIYLDSDLLVLDDLRPLWRMELGHNLLGAVPNVFQANHAQRPIRLGLPPGQRYFNAGVLLMDLSAMRRASSTQQLREFSVTNAERLEWRDQDALNLVLGRRTLPLAPRWNVMNSILTLPQADVMFGREAVALARSSPAIRHYEGPGINKPWHRDSDPLEVERFARFRARTPWPHYRAGGLRFLNRLPAPGCRRR